MSEIFTNVPVIKYEGSDSKTLLHLSIMILRE